MDKLGTISFQANDITDVFLAADVMEDGREQSDESNMGVADCQFGSDEPWIVGSVPKMKSVSIEGDTTIIHAWFKGETYLNEFVITVYVECELVEELIEATSDEVEEVSHELDSEEVNL